MNQSTHARPQNKNKNKIIFSTGAILFLIGFLGMIYNFWISPSDSASGFLPGNTVIFAELNISRSNIIKLKEYNFSSAIDEILAKNLPNINSDDLISWVGKKITFAWLPNNEFVLAGKYRDKNAAKKFMDKFLVADEVLTEKNFAGFTIYSPSFSSQINFVFKDRWLIIASSENSIYNILSAEEKLAKSSKYRKIIKDLPKSREIIGYVNLDELAQSKNSQITANKPLLNALTKTIPALGITIKLTDDGINLNSKLLTTDGVFSSDLLEKTPNEVIPELAQYSPKDALFFMNGFDLNAKYMHTKRFLEKSHPQFALIFDGVLRAEFKKIFGENFDFQTDLLDRIRGQYALIFNFAGKNNPFTYFTLITKFGNGTSAESTEDLKEIIKNAQQNYSTKIAEHEMPDGSIRKELVLAASEEINIVENSANSLSYFTANTESIDGTAVPQQKFSYGFLNGFLVFSNHETGVKDVLHAYTSKESLTKNEDFRESILFDFSASESYGFVNNNKLKELWKISQNSTDTEIKKDNISALLKNFRNFSFARKTFTDATLFSASLKKR